MAAGCTASTTPDAGSDAGVYDQPGPYAAGSAHATLGTRDGGRVLSVELWYPAAPEARAQAETGFPVADFEAEPRRTQLAGWIDQAPEACTPRLAHSARDAALAPGAPWPVLLLSHCTECFRFSMHSLAERLASHGFVVAAPDHLDNTRFDATAPLTNAFLAVRAEDLSSVLDLLLDPTASAVPGVVRGQLDPSRVGVVGHSFGAVTAGRLVELDPRPRGAFLIAAPVDSPFLNSGSITRVTTPMSWLLALEDNSISYLGNGFIRDNFARAPKPAWLIEVSEAGHWTFSDIAGLGGDYLPGCGEGRRDPDGGVFTYLENDVGRRIAQRYVAAWAAHVIRGEEAAGRVLSAPVDFVSVRAR
ncbi:MAG: dienelactone hydrolase family protein [Archangium sp.]|nr:dienelactone hydrolase family protein [Archangium sp.]